MNNSETTCQTEVTGCRHVSTLLNALFSVAGLAICLSCTSARAELIVTISEAFDGGIDLFASGTSDGNAGAGIDNRVDLDFYSDMIFGPGSGQDVSDVATGTITVDGNTFNVTDIGLSRSVANDSVIFFTNGDVGNGTVTANDITGTWLVTNLPFADLTPGTYTGLVAGTTLNVVPEPASLTLLGVAGVVLLRRCRA